MKYFLPGMGADSRMYASPWHKLENCRFIDWPVYNDEASISDVANKLVSQNSFQKNDMIIGSSLGGMVGLEIAQMIGINRVVLLGSAVHPDELSFLSKLSMPLANRPLVRCSQLTTSLFKNDLTLAYAKTDPAFIIAMSNAIFNWEGFTGDMGIVTRIHGKYDPFITCPKNCHTINRGGHLIAFTHAGQCIDILKSLSVL